MPLGATAKYAMLIEGKLHSWNTDSITVQEIQLGDLPPNRAVIEEDLQKSAQRSLDEGEVHRPPRLQEGKELTKKVDFRRG